MLKYRIILTLFSLSATNSAMTKENQRLRLSPKSPSNRFPQTLNPVDKIDCKYSPTLKVKSILHLYFVYMHACKFRLLRRSFSIYTGW